mmetsp:Transcript_3577/g.14445  ORF Transcript_3577/g.14445 Transcript_3577/m.14445 type:complete len:280 (+) Transcript_3577:29-868(+)
MPYEEEKRLRYAFVRHIGAFANPPPPNFSRAFSSNRRFWFSEKTFSYDPETPRRTNENESSIHRTLFGWYLSMSPFMASNVHALVIASSSSVVKGRSRSTCSATARMVPGRFLSMSSYFKTRTFASADASRQPFRWSNQLPNAIVPSIQDSKNVSHPSLHPPSSTDWLFRWCQKETAQSRPSRATYTTFGNLRFLLSSSSPSTTLGMSASGKCVLNMRLPRTNRRWFSTTFAASELGSVPWSQCGSISKKGDTSDTCDHDSGGAGSSPRLRVRILATRF